MLRAAAMLVRTIHDAGRTLTLRQRGEHVDLLLGNVVLLSSAALETERAFGALAAGAHTVVIGGLGFGSTLAGALAVVAPDARVVVAEKLAVLETLLRGDLAHLVDPGVLDDPRVTIVHDDVADVLAGTTGADAILLDVDNGPEWASFRTNARLYAPAGLAGARHALAPSGLFAVWSGYRADPFLPRLRAAGFRAEVLPLRERGVVRAWAYVGRPLDGVPTT